jgi:hypothetical protein
MNFGSVMFKFWRVAGLLALALGLILLGLPGCERSQESFRSVRNTEATYLNPLPDETAQTLRRLEAAKEIDLSKAHQPGSAPIVSSDCMAQAEKADRAIRELSQGFPVAENTLEDALVVPPACFSSAQMAILKRQLQRTIQTDQKEENTEAMESNMGWIPYPTDTMVQLEDHKNQAEGVLKELESGEGMHWETIERATQPAEPQD